MKGRSLNVYPLRDNLPHARVFFIYYGRSTFSQVVFLNRVGIGSGQCPPHAMSEAAGMPVIDAAAKGGLVVSLAEKQPRGEASRMDAEATARMGREVASFVYLRMNKPVRIPDYASPDLNWKRSCKTRKGSGPADILQASDGGASPSTETRKTMTQLPARSSARQP